MTRMIHPADLANIRRIARLIESGKSPWQQNSKNPTIPYSLNEHKYFDTYQTMVMLTKAVENGYKSSGWINSNDLDNSVYQAKGAERPLSLSEPIYLQSKRDLKGNEFNEAGFATYPEICMQDYYNADQCNISFYNRLMNSGAISVSELKKNQAVALDALLTSNPDALEKLAAKDFHNIDSFAKPIDKRYIQGHYSSEYDSRYMDIDYYTSKHFYVLVNLMIEYRLCAELGLEYKFEYPYKIQTGPNETDIDFVYNGNLANAVNAFPEVFISLCEDVDTAVNHFFGRDRISGLEKSLDYQMHSDTNRIDFQEDDILVFPQNENTLSLDTIVKSLKSNIKINDFISNEFVVIDHKGKNIEGLSDTYSSIGIADIDLKKLDERLDFLDEKSPIKFTVYFNKNGHILSYSGRYDIGNNEGGLLQHIRRYCNEHLNSSQYHDFVNGNEGLEGLKSKLDVLSEFRSIVNTLIDRDFNLKSLMALESNDIEISKIQEENKRVRYIEELKEQFDLSHQCKLLLSVYDYLSLDYRERISRESLKNNTCFNLTVNIASDALNGAYARMKLKNYLPANDSRWSTMSTAEAKALAESFKGKITLQQQAYYEKHNIPYTSNTTYAEADKTIKEGKATEKMLTYASTFISKDSLTNLSNQELEEAAKAYEKLVKNRENDPVPKILYDHVVKCGFVKKGENYTYAQWAKDARNCKPTEASKAYVERHKLEDVVKTLMKRYPTVWNKESEALYSYVKMRNDEKIFDCAHSPMNTFQEMFLKNRGIETTNISNWQEAQYCVCDALQKEGYVGLSDVKIIALDTTIKLPEKLSKDVCVSTLSADEKAALAKEIKVLCNDVRRAEKLYRIKISPLENSSSMMNISRQACYEHLVNTGSFKGAVKKVADTLVCSNFNIGKFDRDRIPLVKSINGTDKSTVTNAQVMAHYIVDVLPDFVGKYKDVMPKVLKVVQDAEKSRNLVLQKEAIKEKAKEQSLVNKNENNNGTER